MRQESGNGRRIVKIILVIVVVIAIGLGGYAAYGAYRLNELSKMTFEDMLGFTTRDNPDAVITVGIIQGGRMTYEVYGENGVELPKETHTYEIGSITKTFTTALACKAVSEGRIGFEDTIDRYLDLPEKDHYPTIRSLMTHTSGYKGYYVERPMISNTVKGKNSFNGISEDMLLKRLGKIDLEDSGHPFLYSNFGMATLGTVLEKVYDEDYTELMNGFIAKELGLPETRVSDGSGDLEDYWDWTAQDAYIPAGALFSNIEDMMKYLQMQLHPQPEYLSMAHEVFAEVDATSGTYEKMGIRIDAVGAGWMIDQENDFIWHNGGTGDYNSYMGFDKENQIGVVILANLPPGYRIPATVMGAELLTSLQQK
jgi:CubicO group peptidase (beta-lactamase class C family)